MHFQQLCAFCGASACKTLAFAAGPCSRVARSVAATGASGVSKSAVLLYLLCRHTVEHRCDSLDPAAGWTHCKAAITGAMRPLLRTAARPLRRAVLMRLSSTGALWTKLNELGARPGAINMGQGFPDFAGSAVARDAAKAALDVPALNQYAPINGLAELRDAIRGFYERSYGSHYDDDEVVVTTSGQEALVAA